MAPSTTAVSGSTSCIQSFQYFLILPGETLKFAYTDLLQCINKLSDVVLAVDLDYDLELDVECCIRYPLPTKVSTFFTA